MVLYKGEFLDLKIGDIILYRTGFTLKEPVSILSYLIRVFTKTDYNHCTVVSKAYNKPASNEALGRGVICRDLQEHINRPYNKILVLRKTIDFSEDDFVRTANSKIGIKYDTLSLFQQALYRVFKTWIGETGDEATNRMNCFEYAAWCHKLPFFWLYSGKEFLARTDFEIIYKEQL